MYARRQLEKKLKKNQAFMMSSQFHFQKLFFDVSTKIKILAANSDHLEPI